MSDKTFVDQKIKKRTEQLHLLQKKKLGELKDMAKNLNVKSTGTKAVLCKRIQKAEFHSSRRPPHPLRVKTFQKNKYLQIDTFEKFFSLVLEKNIVVGKFDHRTETVSPLTKNDILTCKQLSIPFQTPTILEGTHQTHRIRQVIDDEESDEEENI